MARATQALGEYQDLASVTAPKCAPLIAGCALGIGAVTKQQDQVSLSVPLYFDESFINASYTDSLDYDGNASKVGTVSYSRPFYWDRSAISLNVFNDFEQKNNYGAYAAVTYSWGKYTASAVAEASNSAYGAGGSFSRSLGQEPGSYGYSVTALEGPQPYNAASAAYRASAFQASAGIIETGKSAQVRAQVDGAVAVLNGVHFANHIDNSFAVVDTGVPNARVLYENNPIGETDGDGALLIPAMRARQENSIAIDPESLSGAGRHAGNEAGRCAGRAGRAHGALQRQCSAAFCDGEFQGWQGRVASRRLGGLCERRRDGFRHRL